MAGTRSGGSSDLGAIIQPIVQQVLMEDVAPTVEDILRRHIETDIYDVYTPKVGRWVGGETYERSHTLESGVTSYMLDPETLIVTSFASADDPIVKGYEFSSNHPGAFLELLASGDMGIWKDGFARPAVVNAQAEVDNSESVRRAIEDGVRRALSRTNI